jgi:hypothetical protein
MIKFGMGNTLLTFVKKYIKYGGDLDVEDRIDNWRIQISLAG